jgi:hypothetical protein
MVPTLEGADDDLVLPSIPTLTRSQSSNTEDKADEKLESLRKEVDYQRWKEMM